MSGPAVREFTPPTSVEFTVAPAVDRPPAWPILVEPAAPAADIEVPPLPKPRQFSLKQMALVTMLLSLMLAPTQWLTLATWAGVLGLVSLAFLILTSLVAIPKGVVLLLASLLLTVYVAAALLAACLS